MAKGQMPDFLKNAPKPTPVTQAPHGASMTVKGGKC